MLTSKQSKRTWKDGGFVDIPVTLKDPQNKADSRGGYDNNASETSKEQMLPSELECPGMPLKKRKAGFLPESEDEAEQAEILGNAPKLHNANTLRVAFPQKTRAANKAQPSPTNRESEVLPFEVSNSPRSPSPDPIMKILRPYSPTFKDVNKPLKFSLLSATPEPSPGQEIQFIDDLRSLGVIPNLTNIIYGLEVSIYDLYNIVNQNHGEYDNVQTGYLWTLIAVQLSCRC